MSDLQSSATIQNKKSKTNKKIRETEEHQMKTLPNCKITEKATYFP